MPHILLTGAGFSRNWGGWLANEVFEYLLGFPEVSKELLWRHKAEGGFEAAYDEVLTKNSLRSLVELTNFDAAIHQMFDDMNEKFTAMGRLDFTERFQGSVTEFLDKCDAIFTLVG